MGDHPELGAFAVGNDEQYRPVQVVGDQRVRVDGPGLLMCHASRPLGRPGPGDGPLVVVVHGALRDSDLHLAHARRAARRVGRDPLIVAPQFLAEVDAGAAADLPDGALYWDVEGWKGGYPALGAAAVSSFAAMDSLLGQLVPLASTGRDPAVVVFGNSAGGQFVNRYAAVGRGPDVLAGRGLRVRPWRRARTASTVACSTTSTSAGSPARPGARPGTG